MKKIVALLLALVLCVSFSACGEDATKPNQNDQDKNQNIGGAEVMKPTAGTTAPEKEIPSLSEPLTGSLGANITFVLDTEGTLTISGEGQIQSFEYGDGVVNTPWFEVRECIRAVVIEEGITGISAHTFYKCFNMESIVIPSTVRSIGAVAFCDCKALKEIVIPEGVTMIGNTTFQGCKSLTRVVLPESLTSIAQNAFLDSGIVSIEIPDNVNFLGRYVFNNCASLKEVKLPASIDEIPVNAFSVCSSLERVEIPEGVTDLKEKAFSNCTALKEIVLPASVTFIGTDVFKNCENLTIIGQAGSYAETYAQQNGFAFRAQ